MSPSSAGGHPTSIGQSPVLLVAVSLLALLVFAGLGIHASLQKYRSAAVTQELMSISVAANYAIHRLQAERGASGVFLSSGGQRFADALPGYHGESDTAVEALRRQVGTTDAATLPGVAAVMDGRTSSATGEIGTIIDDIQSRVGGTVQAMLDTDSEVGSGLELVTRTASAVKEIGGSSDHASENVRGIANAIREQNAAVQQINVEHIAEMTEQNSSAAQDNAVTAAHLEEQVARLDALISRFRL